MACGGSTDLDDGVVAPTSEAGGTTRSVPGTSGFGGSRLRGAGGTKPAAAGRPNAAGQTSNHHTGGTAASPTGGRSVGSAVGGSTGSAGGGSVGSTGGSFNSDCVIHVAETGDDSKSGSDWSLALESVQKGLDAASTLTSQATCPLAEVWVAAGTYTPTYLADPSDARTATFQLLANVALYGGFSGTESRRTDRDLSAHVTILSGDIGTPGDPSDNSYHVVMGVTGATLDGFTITGGFANGAGYGATDSGAGMHNEGDQAGNVAAPTITNCTFANNTAIGNGGAVSNLSAAPTFTNCTFANNSASCGGAMYNIGRSPTITNCTFANNAATTGGGAIFDDCAGMYCDLTSSHVTNCIFWGDTAGTSVSEISEDLDYHPWDNVNYSIVQGGYPWSENIITADPLFVDAANGDFHLRAGSPAIDVGDGCAALAPLTDQAGRSRWDIANVPNAGNAADLGAFEYQGAAGTDTRIAGFSCK